MELSRAEQIIKNKLSNFEGEVHTDSWTQLEKKLDMQHTPIRKFSIMKYSIPVAASLLIGLVTFAAYQITSSIHKHEIGRAHV